MNKYVLYEDVGKIVLTLSDMPNTSLIYALQGLPTIDIVRCKECRHHEDFPTGISPITCSLSWGGVFENDFCSYGEKE